MMMVRRILSLGIMVFNLILHDPIKCELWKVCVVIKSSEISPISVQPRGNAISFPHPVAMSSTRPSSVYVALTFVLLPFCCDRSSS